MLIPVKIKDSIEIEDIEIENINFKSLNLREEHIEEFLRRNIEVIFEDETLLVVGKQVVNKENGRSDLTAVDESGNIVLIEIKRDVADIIQRKEAFEFQAIRYVASYAKIKTPDDLVDKIFVSYIEKYKDEFEIGELTAYEKASRILNNFLEKKNALENSTSKNCFTYLKELASNIDFENDNDFINKQFEAMTTISPTSVLANYLNPKTIRHFKNNRQIIFPFGFNISQKEAAEKALNNQISIIEGPPGTGKTQTILNIIANAIIDNKTVAVVSNNNSATLNVFEKLKKYNVDFIAAYLGNKDNRKDFFQSQNNQYPNMGSYRLDSEELEKIRSFRKYCG
ncbi:AAA domain-containing protein [Clostridium sp. OS1-26]|uniref:AAA domain-containing protein n=1 Tax=Clostridium sp. OS1-26 TaxID=3070681 RepID=UPI0027E13FC6|nr:AAA domain-containing protein [Clostridium sp. OS1-26]WML33425.1 AAA domain-containing protein [Clostridium sp. OS1-26]